MNDYTLQQIFGVTPVVCSRYKRAGLEILRAVLHNLPESQILWPREAKLEHYSFLIRSQHP